MEEGSALFSFTGSGVWVNGGQGLFINRGRAAEVSAGRRATWAALSAPASIFGPGGAVREKLADALLSSPTDYSSLSFAAREGAQAALDAVEEGAFGFEAAALSGLALALSRLCYEASDSLAPKAGRRDERLQRMLSFMEANTSRRLTVDDIAGAGFVSAREASRLFEKHVGVPPMKHFMGLRLDRARVMLEEGAGVGEAAAATGFESVSHFSTCFRKRFSMPPSAVQARP